MPTTKKRLNITLPDHMALFLQQIAVRDDMPQARKAVQLLEQALALEEDAYFDRVAQEREEKGGEFLSHETFWKKIL